MTGLLLTTMEYKLGWYISVIFVAVLFQGAKSNSVERLTLEYTIIEAQQNHLHIGRVGEGAELDKKYPSEVYRSLRYSFLREDPKIQSLFEINSVTGALSTKKSVDREAFCEGPEKECVITFDVAARPVPVRFLEVIVIRIRIEDVNDNWPKFPSRRLELPISESVLPGVELVLPPAQDPDSGSNGVRGYELLSPTQKFDLIVRNMSGGGGLELKLLVKERLDREKTDRYALQLVAWDGGTPAKSGTLDIDITVLDANDNSPQFDNTSYEVTAREDIPIGSIISRIHASDKDTGPNAAVVYSLSSETKKKFGNIFGVKNRSGEIYLKGPLDYESEKIYQLSVTANDQGGWDSVPAHARVNVHVIDVNDHAPVIRVNSLTTSRQVEISENSEANTFVTHLSVEDSDSGINGQVTCFLQDYAVHLFAIEKLYANEYTISTISASFDREHQATHLITVVCEDHGIPSLQSTKQIVVKLLDLNDHRPVFSKEVYSFRTRENNTIYTQLITVNATDLDEGENGRITYRLHSDARRLVRIDSTSGLISTNALLDFEKMHQFQFRVIASDNGKPKRSSTATIVLNLVDINDEAPVFPEPAPNFGVYENKRPGLEVGIVTAIDPDSTPYNVVRYSLNAMGAAKNTFIVDPETGRITTRTQLDREYQAQYSFILLAGNPGFPHTTSSVTVTVYVLDENDNAPHIEFPNSLNNSVQVPYLAPKGYVLTRVFAYDSDYGNNARLTYSIAEGNNDGLFDIDRRTGAIMVAVPLLQPQVLHYSLSVMVQDGAIPPLSAVGELNIVVNKTATMFAHRKSRGGSASGATNNLTIVIALGVATAVLIVVLLFAIFLIKKSKRSRGKNSDVYRYTRRVDLASRAAAASPKHPPLSPSSTNPAGYKDDSPPDGMPSPESPTEKHHLNQCGMVRDGKYEGNDPRGPFLSRKAVDSPPPSGNTHLQASNHQNAQENEMRSEFGLRQLMEPPGVEGSDGGEGSVMKAYTYRDPRGDPRQEEEMTPRDPHHLPRHRLLYDPVHGTVTKHTKLTEKDLEVHQLLHILMREGRTGHDSDSVSGCSADMSNTDSGRGPSEDGDTGHGRHDTDSGPPPPPYDALWEDKRKSAGCADLKPVPEEMTLSRHHPPSDINNIIPPYTTTFSPTRDSTFTTRRYAPTANTNPQKSLPVAAVRRMPPAPRQTPNNRTQELVRSHNLSGSSGSLPRSSPRGSPAGSKDSLTLEGQIIDTGAKTHSSSKDSKRSKSDKNKSGEEGIYVNTFGHKMPLHPLGRVEETQDEGSDDSASTTTSGSFEVDQGDRCSGNSVQTVINATHMDTVV